MNQQHTRRATLLTAGGLGLAASGVAHGQEDKKKPPSPGKDYFASGSFELVTPAGLRKGSYRTNVSPDGLAFTVLFDSLQVSAGGAAGPSAVQVAVLRVPFALPAGKRLAGFTQHVRGAVSKSRAARAAVIADLGCLTRVFEVQPENEPPADGTFQHSFASPAGRDGGPGAAQQYTVTLVLTAQALAKGDTALLSVDSLDVEALLYPGDVPARPRPPAKKPAKP